MLFFRPYKSSLYETTEMFSQKAELVSSLIKLWGGNVLIVNKLLWCVAGMANFVALFVYAEVFDAIAPDGEGAEAGFEGLDGIVGSQQKGSVG